MSVRFSWFIVLFKFSTSSIYVVVLSITESGVLKNPTITVELSPYISVSFCFLYLVLCC